MDIPDPAASEVPPLWPGVWIPLIILIAGLAVTGVAATVGAGLSRDLAEARYHAQHQTLVNRLLTSVPAFVSDTDQPSDWLSALFYDAVPANLGLRIDTLRRHTKQPLFQVRAHETIDPTLALRTEVDLGHQRWMLTTLPSLLNEGAKRARSIIWSAGVIFSTLVSLLALLLCRRLHRQSLQVINQERRETGANQQITNMQVEKSILHQALTDSEQRSRDLIALSGAIIFELDESGCIGFTSPQIAALLDRAPADLIGQPFNVLITPLSKDNVDLAMSAARTEHSIQRIDLSLLHRDAENPVSVVLRLRALQDPVHGFVGYRLSALPNAAISA